MTEQPKIIGYVTHLSPDQVRGFAFSIADTEPVHVSLFFKNELVHTQLANLESGMLAERELSANHGYYFDLKSIGAYHPGDALEVRVNDVSLPMAPHLNLARHKHGLYKPQIEPLFFFMHIPKTAGTSFRMLLNRQFDQDEIWPNKSDLAKNDRRYPAVSAMRELTNERLNQVNLMLGHYPLWSLRFMRKRPDVITFLRQPEEQMLSLVIHKKLRTPALAKKTLEQIAESEIMKNPQTYFFLPAHVSTEEISEEMFQVALRNLNSCAFVGLRERFEEGLDYLERTFGWSLGKRITKNVGEKAKVSTELKEIIYAKCEVDRRLYEAAVRNFNQLLANK